MKKKSFFKTIYFAAGIGLAVAASILAGVVLFGTLKVFARDDLPVASYCSFILSPEFVPSGEKGLFINENHPMESSSVKYSYYDNGLDKLPTNRERLETIDDGSPKAIIADKTAELTKDIYEETIAAAYNSEYGQDVGYKVSSFDNMTIDGFPAYKIVGSYRAGEEETVHQTVIMVMARYRTFTITYQRADDDECQELFAESEASIHVH